MQPRPRTRRVEFSRRKYGAELLVDAAMLSAMPAFEPIPQPHHLDFYDLLLITNGSGWFELDDERHPVTAGQLFLTRPGQTRRWTAREVDGACIFFTVDFIHELFGDARLLEQLAYFDAARPTGAIALSAAERRQFMQRFARMDDELDVIRPDATNLLRATLHELLVLLNRWYVSRFPAPSRSGSPALVGAFANLVERDFRQRHHVRDYAAALDVSTAHLNVLCNRCFGCSASTVIHRRLLLEAKRLLRYSAKPAFAIAVELGFSDPSYFGRFFQRETGMTPRHFRVDG